MAKSITLPELTKRDETDNTNIIINDEPQLDHYNDEIAIRVVDELLDLSKLKTISRIKPEQVSILTKLALFSACFNVPFTNDLADHILQLQISLNGYGRKELVQLVSQRMNNPIDDQLTSKDIFK